MPPPFNLQIKRVSGHLPACHLPPCLWNFTFCTVCWFSPRESSASPNSGKLPFAAYPGSSGASFYFDKDSILHILLCHTASLSTIGAKSVCFKPAFSSAKILRAILRGTHLWFVSGDLTSFSLCTPSSPRSTLRVSLLTRPPHFLSSLLDSEPSITHYLVPSAG
jgi:hypothetical protein